MSNLHQRLLSKDATMSVVGLGYVGLPIALAFAKHLKVIGFDIHQGRVEMMRRGEDPSEEIPPKGFEGCDITFTANADDLQAASFHIVAVPTPIHASHQPDLGPLLAASRTVGKALKKGDIVVYESTVYPGCTEDDCIPILERESGLRFGEDFGGLGRSWGPKLETGRRKKSNKKRKTKPTWAWDDGNESTSAPDAEAGKEGFRAAGLVRPIS